MARCRAACMCWLTRVSKNERRCYSRNWNSPCPVRYPLGGYPSPPSARRAAVRRSSSMWRAQSTIGVSSLALLTILESARAASTCDRTSAAADIVCSQGVRHTIDRQFHYHASCYIQGAGVRDSESCPPGWAFQDIGVFKQCVLDTPALNLNGAKSLNKCGEMCSMEGESVESVCCTETEAHIPDGTSVMINAIVSGQPTAADCPAGWEFQPEWGGGQCLLQPGGSQRLTKIPACSQEGPASPSAAPAGASDDTATIAIAVGGTVAVLLLCTLAGLVINRPCAAAEEGREAEGARTRVGRYCGGTCGGRAGRAG